MPRILFVSGFHPSTRARDLAYEFERYAIQQSFSSLCLKKKIQQVRSSCTLRCSSTSQPARQFQPVSPL